MSRTPIQGYFKPKNPSKYKGDKNNIIFRSLLEYNVMKFFDENESILEYSSEETYIKYLDVTTNKIRTYFPDFKVKYIDNKGNIRKKLIEVKPSSQVREPKKPKRLTQAYEKRVFEWVKNQCKWESAREWCKKTDHEFEILTEKEIMEFGYLRSQYLK